MLLVDKLLASRAIHVQMTLYNDAPAGNGTGDHHYISYLISGNGLAHINRESLELEFRQKLMESRLAGTAVWGLSMTEPVSEAGPTINVTELPSTVARTNAPTTEYVALQEPFAIVDSVMLPFVSQAEVSQLLQQIKEYWIVVLGTLICPCYNVDLHLIELLKS